MGQFSKERMVALDNISWRYYDWLTVLGDAGVRDIQDLQGQYLLKCPFHEDKRPSFRIRVHEHNYHCFSCGAFGSVASLMWKLSETRLSQVQYYEQLLKANPAMQKELGFNSLFLDAKTLDPRLTKPRKFNPKSSIGTQMPVSALGRKVRAMQDDWKGLVYSLTMLQHGETTDNIYAQMCRVTNEHVQVAASKERVGVVSLMDLLGDSDDFEEDG